MYVDYCIFLCQYIYIYTHSIHSIYNIKGYIRHCNRATRACKLSVRYPMNYTKPARHRLTVRCQECR